jgi:hypothetical protein
MSVSNTRRTKAKIAKPPPDPDSEAARQIKGLKTRVRNQQAELAHAWDVAKRGGKMTKATRNTITNGLQADRTPTKEERHEATAALNVFWGDQTAGGGDRPIPRISGKPPN